MTNSYLSQKQIGKRIALLRNHKGLSQEELANNMNISRPSLAQIELGNRNISVLEFQRFSNILEFSLDHFLSSSFSITEIKNTDNNEISEENKIRISEPTLKIKKFNNVLLYILEKCAGKPNVNESVIYKLLYFADFNYYELYEEHLTGAKYYKLPFGPIPQNIQIILNQMIKDDKLKRIKTDYHKSKQIRYIPLVKSNLTQLKASEKDILDTVIEQFSNWSNDALSNYAHKDIPWIVTKDKQEINYELALYREVPYSVRNYEEII